MVSSGSQSWCYLISISLVSSLVQGEFIYVVPSLVEVFFADLLILNGYLPCPRLLLEPVTKDLCIRSMT